jgi:hypothetical protein
MMRKRKEMEGWERAGVVGVDSAMLWIGDPCYVLHRALPKEVGRDWDNFCKINMKIRTNPKQFQRGIGVNFLLGADGVYPVYVRKDARGVVVAAKVEFTPLHSPPRRE